MSEHTFDISLTGHSSYVHALLLLPDGSIVSGSYDKTIKVLDTKDGFACTHTLTRHSNTVYSLLLIPDGIMDSG
jgi:WD40 repeat protein